MAISWSNERNKRNNSNYRVAQTQMMTHTKGEPHGLPRDLFSLNRPLGRFSHRVAMSVCLSVCVRVRHTLETTLPDGLETSVSVSPVCGIFSITKLF